MAGIYNPYLGQSNYEEYSSPKASPFNMAITNPSTKAGISPSAYNPSPTSPDYSQGGPVQSLGSPASAGMSLETATAFAPKTGAGSAVGAAIGTAIAPGIGTMVGGAIGAVGDTIINWLSESYAQDEYAKVQAENRKYAEKIYREQLAREEEQKQYERGIYNKERAYKLKQDKKAEDWAIKQDKYGKYLQQVSSFSNFLNSDGQVRQNLITNWQNQSRLKAA